MSSILNSIYLCPTWIYISKDKKRIVISKRPIMPDALDTLDGEQFESPIIIRLPEEFLKVLDELVKEKYPYFTLLRRE